MIYSTWYETDVYLYKLFPRLPYFSKRHSNCQEHEHIVQQSHREWSLRISHHSSSSLHNQNQILKNTTSKTANHIIQDRYQCTSHDQCKTWTPNTYNPQVLFSLERNTKHSYTKLPTSVNVKFIISNHNQLHFAIIQQLNTHFKHKKIVRTKGETKALPAK